ncbi:MAG TPA: hypothetical protein VIW78_11320 [Burkholderiales bacterium]
MSLDQLVGQLSKDWEWVSFITQYCAGSNIGKPVCEDFRWWAIGIAALALAIVVWWIFGQLSKAYARWHYRRVLAKVADAETMNKHRWSGPDLPDALKSPDQRATKSPK